MSSKRERIGDLFIRSKAMLEVAMTDDDIKKALPQYNYDDNILAEGRGEGHPALHDSLDQSPTK